MTTSAIAAETLSTDRITCELPNHLVVERHTIIGTTYVIHSVWERDRHHTCLKSFDGVSREATGQLSNFLGKVGTGPLPPELEALPTGDERCTKVKAFQKAEYNRAYDILLAAFPYLATEDRHQTMGQIECMA